MPNTPGTPHRHKIRRILKVQDFVDRIFKSHDPIALADKFLNSENEVVASKVFMKLLEYKYGLPVQSIEHSGKDGAPLLVLTSNASSPRT